MLQQHVKFCILVCMCVRHCLYCFFLHLADFLVFMDFRLYNMKKKKCKTR